QRLRGRSSSENPKPQKTKGPETPKKILKRETDPRSVFRLRIFWVLWVILVLIQSCCLFLKIRRSRRGWCGGGVGLGLQHAGYQATRLALARYCQLGSRIPR
ncbi:MAG: hypothetical protein ACK55Z_04640, partial [bacterium]